MCLDKILSRGASVFSSAVVVVVVAAVAVVAMVLVMLVAAGNVRIFRNFQFLLSSLFNCWYKQFKICETHWFSAFGYCNCSNR